MKKLFFIFILTFIANSGFGLIIDHNCIYLDQIPSNWIEQAKSQFRLAYAHTSHGSQIRSGMDAIRSNEFSLYYYDEAVTNNTLSYFDYTNGSPFGDLGHNGYRGWYARTTNALENTPYAQANLADWSDRNLVMWSWCGGASDNTPAGITVYLNDMNQLETDYPGVTFIYMTGHLDGGGTNGNSSRRALVSNQQIRDYCIANNKILYDFADIESYPPYGLTNFATDPYLCNDACEYYNDSHVRVNWAQEWENDNPDHGWALPTSASHTALLNGAMKGRAFWWLLARIAGWSGNSSETGKVSFVSENYFAEESAGTVAISVEKTGGDALTSTVHYATANGTAISGTDYTSTSGDLTWNSGDTAAKIINIPISQDSVGNTGKYFSVSLSSPTNATFGDIPTTTVNINDDDIRQLNFSSATYIAYELNGAVAIIVESTGASAGEATVHYTTSDGTASNGQNYTAISGDFVWTNGESGGKTFFVDVAQNSVGEPARTFFVNLTSPSNAFLISPETAEVTIIDDDLQTLEVQINLTDDDVEECLSSGDYYGDTLGHRSHLEMVVDGSYVLLVGLRFNKITIPQGSQITNAYIQFTVDDGGPGNNNPCNLLIEGQKVCDAPEFEVGVEIFGVSSLTRTDQSVSWSPPNWGAAGTASTDQRTPTLEPIIQELVDQFDWTNGNSMAFIISGEGTRSAEVFNDVPANAAYLRIDYTPPIPEPCLFVICYLSFIIYYRRRKSKL